MIKLVAADLMFYASLSKHPMDVYYSPLRYRNIHRMFLHTTQYSFGISNSNMPLLRIIASGNELKVANPQQLMVVKDNKID